MQLDEQNTALAPVVWLAQAPEFGERLAALKAEWDALATEAEAMEVSDENRTEARKRRTEIRKRFEEIEAQRKDALAPVRERMEAFQAVYKECVTDSFWRADDALKTKIETIETKLKADCEQRLRDYWRELSAANNIDFFEFERTGVAVTLTEARQKTPKKLMELLQNIVANARNEMETISRMENSAEIMVEYRKTLNLAQSMEIVRRRHEQIEAERQAAQARQEVERRQAAVVEKVKAAASEVLAPPVPVPAPIKAKAEAAFPDTFGFTLHFESAEQWEAIKPILITLRDALKKSGVRYE